MTKVLDDAAVERAFRAAERALAQGDPDTLAGRFAPPSPSWKGQPITGTDADRLLPPTRRRKRA